MTAPADLLTRADALLLDFDGPLADLMPPPVNAQAADAARAALPHVNLPPEVATTTDHLAVLRHILKHHCDLTAIVERACTRAEVAAARRCSPSAHAENLFALIRRRELPCAVVSNNSEEAVRVFLDRQGWTTDVAVFSCRDEHNADHMKPSPLFIEKALSGLGLEPGRALFIGDSVSDVQAATAAGVRILGLAKHTRGVKELSDAGAAAVASLTDAFSI